MASSELKPCPFCGGKAIFEENHDVDYYADYPVRIECTNKCAFTSWKKGEKWEPGRGTFSIQEESKKSLAEQWNRRADPKAERLLEAAKRFVTASQRWDAGSFDKAVHDLAIAVERFDSSTEKGK